MAGAANGAAKPVAGNPLTGEAVIKASDGRELRLQITIRRMLEIEAALGEGYQERFIAAMQSGDLRTVATVAAIAMRQHQPDITEDDVLDLDVPWLELQGALLAAWRRFFSGDKPLPIAEGQEGAGPLSMAPATRAMARS